MWLLGWPVRPPCVLYGEGFSGRKDLASVAHFDLQIYDSVHAGAVQGRGVVQTKGFKAVDDTAALVLRERVKVHTRDEAGDLLSGNSRFT